MKNLSCAAHTADPFSACPAASPGQIAEGVAKHRAPLITFAIAGNLPPEWSSLNLTVINLDQNRLEGARTTQTIMPESMHTCNSSRAVLASESHP